jgi:hypothetical protein
LELVMDAAQETHPTGLATAGPLFLVGAIRVFQFVELDG